MVNKQLLSGRFVEVTVLLVHYMTTTFTQLYCYFMRFLQYKRHILLSGVCVVQLKNLWVNGCDFPKMTQLRIRELLLCTKLCTKHRRKCLHGRGNQQVNTFKAMLR